MNWPGDKYPTEFDLVQIDPAVNIRDSVSAGRLVANGPVEVSSRAIRSRLLVGDEAVFNSSVSINEANWIGGKVRFRGVTDILIRGITTVNQDWDNEGHLRLHPNGSGLVFGNDAYIQSTVRNAKSGVWEMLGSIMGPYNDRLGPVEFVNEGQFIARGAVNQIHGIRFTSLGSLEVREGQLSIRGHDPLGNAARILGSVHIHSGAALKLLHDKLVGEADYFSEFGRFSRFFGDGDFEIETMNMPGSYALNGTTTISRADFSGPVNSGGLWKVGQATFSGRNSTHTGRIGAESLSINAPPKMRMNDVTVINLNVATALETTGTLELKGGLLTRGLTGDGRLRTLGSLVVFNAVNSSGLGVLEIGATAASGTPTASLGAARSGFALRVLPEGSLNLNGFTSVNVRDGIANDGLVTKSDVSRTDLGNGFQNRGKMLLNGGSLWVVDGSYIQTAGTTTFGGGQMSIWLKDFTKENFMRLAGGLLEGAGTLNCGSVVNQARLSPGTTTSPTGIFDFQVGTHATRSVYQQDAAATLAMDLLGTTPGTGHDQVIISGRALLGGTLEINAPAEVDPAIGQEFTILTASKVEGTFGQVVANRTMVGKKFAVIYQPKSVKVAVVASP